MLSSYNQIICLIFCGKDEKAPSASSCKNRLLGLASVKSLPAEGPACPPLACEASAERLGRRAQAGA